MIRLSHDCFKMGGGKCSLKCCITQFVCLPGPISICLSVHTVLLSVGIRKKKQSCAVTDPRLSFCGPQTLFKDTAALKLRSCDERRMR